MPPSLKQYLLGEARTLRTVERMLWDAWRLAKDWNGSPATEILATIAVTNDRRRGLIERAWKGRKTP